MALLEFGTAVHQLSLAAQEATDVWSQSKDPMQQKLARALLFTAAGMKSVAEGLDETYTKLEAVGKAVQVIDWKLSKKA